MTRGQSTDLHYGVAIPAYNAARTLAAAIESVLIQTFPPAEVLIVNDGSTDDTSIIAASFGDPVRLLSQPNAGPAAATDRALAALTAPVVAGLDADDLWRPDKAERQLEALANTPDLDAVFCRASIFLHGERPGATERSQDLWGRSAMMMRRSASDRLGPVSTPDRARTLGEMIRWFDRGRRLGLTFRMMPETLVDRRIIPGSLSFGQSATGLLSVIREKLEERQSGPVV